MGLALNNITHRFGDTLAVNDASLRAERGEIVCLFGHSGCGKTTLLRIAAGLEPLQEGVVELDGETLAAPGYTTPPERRPIGFVFQDFVLFPHLTVEKNIAFGLRGASDAKMRIAEQLSAMGLQGFERRWPHELSGGQQQRVALARALAPRPGALLMDEPFASIDGVLRRRLREDLRRILKGQNVAVILVTHDPEEALALGDRIAFMRAGRIVETASPETLFAAPQTPEGAGLFPGSQILKGAIAQERLHTPAGVFPAKGLPDGDGVAVLRDGALKAAPDENGVFRIADARFAGPGWIAIMEDVVDAVRLRVRMEERPEIGARMTAAADMLKTFVFAADDAD